MEKFLKYAALSFGALVAAFLAYGTYVESLPEGEFEARKQAAEQKREASSIARKERVALRAENRVLEARESATEKARQEMLAAARVEARRLSRVERLDALRNASRES